MPLSASVNPTSGPTPTQIEVTASGGTPAYTLTADPSPPNPSSMPDYTITPDPLDSSKWKVSIEDPVANGTKLYFTVTDQQQDSAGVEFTCS